MNRYQNIDYKITVKKNSRIKRLFFIAATQ